MRLKWEHSSLSVTAFIKEVAHLDRQRCFVFFFFKCTRLYSPSLLLQEKPKQRRKTNTKEIHIMATDALADLVRSGGSPTNKQWQKSKEGAPSLLTIWVMITDLLELSSASPLLVLILLS